MLKIRRSNPLFQIHDGSREWVRHHYKVNIKLTRLCLATSQGRSVSRLTKVSRSIFLQQLRNKSVWGLQKSSW